MKPEIPGSEVHVRISMTSRPSIQILLWAGEGRGRTHSVLGESAFDPHEEPQAVLRKTEELLDSLIAESKVDSNIRESLLREMRTSYCRLFSSFPLF